MTLSEAISSVRITDVWASLGGTPPRHGRGRAFYRKGDGYNVALDDSKPAWFDHVQGKGGGVLDLIRAVLSCDRAGAVAWLADTYALDIERTKSLTGFERRRYAKARCEAEQFVAWRKGQISEMRLRRNYHLETYHNALRRILRHGLNHPLGAVWADACESHEHRYQSLDMEIDGFVDAPFASLMPTFERRSA